MQEPQLHDEIRQITRQVYTVSALVGQRRSRYIELNGCDIFHPRKTINNSPKSERCFVEYRVLYYRIEQKTAVFVSCDLYDAHSEELLDSINQFVFVMERQNVCLMCGKN
jgi:hypothetical protein